MLDQNQAEIFANLHPIELPQDSLTKLFTVVKGLPRVASEVPKLTPTEKKMFVMEEARLILDDYPEEVRDQAAQVLEISSAELRKYFKDHDENGRWSPRERKVLSRARDKVKKAMSFTKFLSLLVIVLALAFSLGLCIAIHRGYSMHQDEFVNQGSFDHQNDLAHQDNLIDPNALARQGNLVRKNLLGHQQF